MYAMFENMSRGGISYSFTRHAEANNKYMKNYNPNEKTSYINY